MEGHQREARAAGGRDVLVRGDPRTHPAGEYVELDPPHRLVFTWGWEKSDSPSAIKPGTSTIEVELTPEGDGTRLHFVHRDLPSEAAAESHAVGWDHYLSRLEVAAAGGDPGEDPWLTQDMESTS